MNQTFLALLRDVFGRWHRALSLLNPFYNRKLLQSLLSELASLERKIDMNQAELKAALEAATTKTLKVIAEVRDAVTALQAAIAAGTTSPEVDAALASLQAALQTADDLNPDAPV
jgi:predicted  nucleic acid-binding Zn-ribbon protein